MIQCSTVLAAGIDTYIAGMALLGVIVVCVAAVTFVRRLSDRVAGSEDSLQPHS